MDDATLTQRQRERLFSGFNQTQMLCDGGSMIEIAGRRLCPDEDIAFVEFVISNAFPTITAYGATFHPGTVANSWRTMENKVFNLSHLMKSYDDSKEKNEIARDWQLGTVVAVELLNPNPPMSGWQFSQDPAKSTGIRGVAVMHKAAERVPKILGEHLGGRYKWTVSMEVEYTLAESGFMVANRSKAKKKAADLMDAYSPREMSAMDLGYVPVVNAPLELFECYSREKRRIVKPWDGLPVVMVKGGINGQARYYGVGLVRVGAEREAEVTRMLASDPDALEQMLEERSAELLGYFQKSSDEGRNLLTLFQKAVPPKT